MDLNQLGTTALQDTVDFDNLPQERGQSAPPPTPGAYRFELTPLDGGNFEPVKSEKYGDRLKVKFDANSPLKIVQSPKDLHNGEPFTTTLSNVPRQRGKDETNIASDLDYLNKALEIPKRPTTNKGYAEVLIAASLAKPAKDFAADIEWTWNCSETRDAYFTTTDQATGNVTGSAPVPDPNTPGQNIKGCGAKYYQGQPGKGKAADPAAGKAGYIEPENGAYPLHVGCNCGASIRAFGNLARIRK